MLLTADLYLVGLHDLLNLITDITQSDIDSCFLYRMTGFISPRSTALRLVLHTDPDTSVGGVLDRRQQSVPLRVGKVQGEC